MVTGIGGARQTYQTALIPAVVQGQAVTLFAAVAPRKDLNHSVIVGRAIPGKKVTWKLEINDLDEEDTPKDKSTEEGDQDSSQGTKPTLGIDTLQEESAGKPKYQKKRKRRKKQKTSGSQPESEQTLRTPLDGGLLQDEPAGRQSKKKSQQEEVVQQPTTPKENPEQLTPAQKLTNPVNNKEAVDMGITMEQKQEDNNQDIATTVGAESQPTAGRNEITHQSAPIPAQPGAEAEFEDAIKMKRAAESTPKYSNQAKATVLTVETRAAKQRREQQEEEDRKLTQESGVQPSQLHLYEQSEDSEEEDNNSDLDTTTEYPEEEWSDAVQIEQEQLTNREEFIKEQKRDPELQRLCQTAQDEESPYKIKDDILMVRERSGKVEATYLVVVPEKL